ncbi:MAG: hypothetical protein QM765_15205 [Myxococcales bacterium]
MGRSASGSSRAFRGLGAGGGGRHRPLEMLEGFHAWAPIAAWFGSLGLAVVLQRWQVGLRRLERYRWWASNGRDVLNLAALCLLAESLRAMGFGGPEALLVAATVLLPLVLLSSLAAGRRGLTAWLSAAATAVGVPVAAVPGRIWLWPRPSPARSGHGEARRHRALLKGPSSRGRRGRSCA